MNEQIEMKEFEKDFYAQLGLLSVKFSKMDYSLSVILQLILGTEDNTIAATLIENNSLDKNISLIRKINRIRQYQEGKLTSLLDDISRIKENRNLFVHGLWQTPVELDGEIKIICQSFKITYSENKDKHGRVFQKKWKINENHVFSLSQIKEQIVKIDEILLILHQIIEKLDMDSLQGFPT